MYRYALMMLAPCLTAAMFGTGAMPVVAEDTPATGRDEVHRDEDSETLPPPGGWWNDESRPIPPPSFAPPEVHEAYRDALTEWVNEQIAAQRNGAADEDREADEPAQDSVEPRPLPDWPTDEEMSTLHYDWASPRADPVEELFNRVRDERWNKLAEQDRSRRIARAEQAHKKLSVYAWAAALGGVLIGLRVLVAVSSRAAPLGDATKQQNLKL